MAINGNPTGIFIWIVAQIAVMVFRWKQLEFAYREGISLVTTMQHRLTALTDACNFTRGLHGWRFSGNDG